MIRALLDTNIYISYLLNPDAASAPIRILETAVDGAWALLVTDGVIAELRDKIATKPYLMRRISPDQLERLVRIIMAVGEEVPEIESPYPEIGTDRKDDYLYAHAVLVSVDFLVSGDKGVLAVQRIGDVEIVSPSDFLRILMSAGLI